MSLLLRLQRHWEIFVIHFIGVLQYRVRTFVWFLVGGVNTVILLLYWTATLKAGVAEPGATLAQLSSYYVLLLLFSTVVMCHVEEDIAYRDIQKGDIYGYLLRPYSYIAIKFQQEIVWRFLSGFWSLLTIILLTLGGFQFSFQSAWFVFPLAMLSVVLGLLTSFFLKVCLGLVSIWVTNIRGIMDLYAISEILLAGFVIPLALFPVAFRTAAELSPLATFVYYPVRILTAPLSLMQVMEMIAVQLFWLAFFALAANVVFRKGIRHYSGVSQ